MNISRHKVFISYYHAEDQSYKNHLLQQNQFHNIFDDYSVREDDIDDTNLSSEQIRRTIRDNYMKNATVLLLLCGKNTRRRKHIDWEIHTAMYHSDKNPQMGIVVVNLPTISQCQRSGHGDDKQYFGGDINWVAESKIRKDLDESYPYLPERIVDNFTRDEIYVPVVNWNTIVTNPVNIAGIIDVAFNNRYKNKYHHSEPLRRNNS